MEIQHHAEDGLVSVRHEGRVAHGDVHAHGAEEVHSGGFAGVDFDVFNAELIACNLLWFEMSRLRKISLSISLIATVIITPVTKLVIEPFLNVFSSHVEHGDSFWESYCTVHKQKRDDCFNHNISNI